VTFLAGGVAFNVLLAGVPFILILASGLGFLLGESMDATAGMVREVLDELVPALGAEGGSILDPVMEDIVRTRAAYGIGGAIGFLVFSARLFGSLRAVMKRAFDHGSDRTLLGGMLWDVNLSVISAVLLVGWVALSAWLAVSRGRLGVALTELGVFQDLMSGLEYALVRLAALALLSAVFTALYRWLPKRRTPWLSALAGGVTAGVLFEVARVVFAIAVRNFPPGSIWTGTLGALVVIVFWTYYAALTFVLGAETASATQDELAPSPP
jgi:membrane protein